MVRPYQRWRLTGTNLEPTHLSTSFHKKTLLIIFHFSQRVNFSFRPTKRGVVLLSFSVLVSMLVNTNISSFVTFFSSHSFQCVSRSVWWFLRMSIIQTWCVHHRRVFGTGK